MESGPKKKERRRVWTCSAHATAAVSELQSHFTSARDSLREAGSGECHCGHDVCGSLCVGARPNRARLQASALPKRGAVSTRTFLYYMHEKVALILLRISLLSKEEGMYRFMVSANPFLLSLWGEVWWNLLYEASSLQMPLTRQRRTDETRKAEKKGAAWRRRRAAGCQVLNDTETRTQNNLWVR